MNQVREQPLEDDHAPPKERSADETGGPGAEAAWQVAEQRLIVYLRLLNYPVIRGLELALGAMRRSRTGFQPGTGDHPAAAAMRALRALLREEAVSPIGRQVLLSIVDGEMTGGAGSAPSLNRGSMVPECIE